MEGYSVAVTGATGFIGRELCARLADRRTWTAIGRSAPDGLPMDWRKVDLQVEAEARAAVPPGTRVLVHLAAHRGGMNDATGHFRGTTAAAMYLGDSMRRERVQRAVLASSTSVYEPSTDPERLLRENAARMRYRPLTQGFVRKWAEDALRLQAMLAEPMIELWVLRLGLVVGQRARAGSWLGTTLDRLKRGEPHPLIGDRGHRYGLVAMEDVLDTLAVAIAAESPGHEEPPGPVWNVVGEALWEREIVERLAAGLGVAATFEPAPPPGRGFTDGPVSVAGDGTLWRESLGIDPRPVGALLEAVGRRAR